MECKFASEYSVCSLLQDHHQCLTCDSSSTCRIRNLKDPATESLLRNVSWACSNLIRGKPTPPLEVIQPFIKPFVSALVRCEEGGFPPETEEDSAWALSYILDGGKKYIDACLQRNVLNVFINLLEKKLDCRTLAVPVTRGLGNIVTGTDEQADQVIQAGFFKYATALLTHPRKCIRRESCWIMSNFAAGSQEQIDCLFTTDGLMHLIVEAANKETWEVRKEAIWTLTNIITTGDDKHMRTLVNDYNLIETLCSAMKIQNEVTVLLQVLDAVMKVLDNGFMYGRPYASKFDEHGGIDSLEEMQNHANAAVYDKAYEILTVHFNGEEEDDENDVLAPETTDDNFQFGLTSKQLFPGASTPVPVKFNFGGSNAMNL